VAAHHGAGRPLFLSRLFAALLGVASVNTILRLVFTDWDALTAMSLVLLVVSAIGLVIIEVRTRRRQERGGWDLSRPRHTEPPEP
jgi:hypothetical protein